jgi:hypothetical protein
MSKTYEHAIETTGVDVAVDLQNVVVCRACGISYA